jgi:hypothetical protein
MTGLPGWGTRTTFRPLGRKRLSSAPPWARPEADTAETMIATIIACDILIKRRFLIRKAPFLGRAPGGPRGLPEAGGLERAGSLRAGPWSPFREASRESAPEALGPGG